jgi:hypothetical protein
MAIEVDQKATNAREIAIVQKQKYEHRITNCSETASILRQDRWSSSHTAILQK